MKVYRGSLYVLDSNIPYVDNCYLYGQYYHTNNGIARKIKVSEFLEIEEQFGKKIFSRKGTITVLKLPFGRVKCVQTGIVFPTMKIAEQEQLDLVYTRFTCKNNGKEDNPHCYLLSKPNYRLYVQIEEELNNEEVQIFYEGLTEEKIKTEIKCLEQLISEQSQYQKEKRLSNRQYVKKIEQMRNNIKK